jgi:hypothetical protein
VKHGDGLPETGRRHGDEVEKNGNDVKKETCARTDDEEAKHRCS